MERGKDGEGGETVAGVGRGGGKRDATNPVGWLRSDGHEGYGVVGTVRKYTLLPQCASTFALTWNLHRL